MEALLSYYLLDTPKQMRGGHGMLVLPPLMITLAFCYLFVMMQPHDAHSHTSASSQASPSEQDTKTALPDLPIKSEQTLPPISSTVVDSTSSTTKPSESTVTATPQPSTNGTTSLQAGSISTGEPITIKVGPTSISSSSLKSSTTKSSTSSKSTTTTKTTTTKKK